MAIVNYCKNCAYNRDHVCILHNYTVTDEDFCSKWSKTLCICEGCHKPLLPEGIVLVTDPNSQKIYSFCGSCANQFCMTHPYNSEVENG